MNRAGMKSLVAVGMAASLCVTSQVVATAEDAEPQWDFGRCGKLHLVAVNSASDSKFGQDSDQDAGFFADNITLPVLERVGQSSGGDVSGGIVDEGSSQEDLWAADSDSEKDAEQDWFSAEAGSSSAQPTPEVDDWFTPDPAATAEPTEVADGGAGDGQASLTRTYINVDSLQGEVEFDDAQARTNAVLGKVAEECPDTRVVLVGFAEGAQVASMVAREIGAGSGAVEPSRIAGVALFSDPTRDPGQEVVASGAAAPEGMELGAGEPLAAEVGDGDVAAGMSSAIAAATEEASTTAEATAAQTLEVDSSGASESMTAASPEGETSTSASSTVEESATKEPGEASAESSAEASATAASASAVEPSALAAAERQLPAGVSSLPRQAPEGYGNRGVGGSSLGQIIPGSFTAPQGANLGGGVASVQSAVDGFGALAAKTVSWCIEGDLACGMPEGSAMRTIVDSVAPDLDTNNPMGSLMAVADTLGPAVVLGGLEAVADGVSFGSGGFKVARADSEDETLIGRIATEAARSDSRSLGEMGTRVLGASAKIAGMGLAAGITVARKTLSPANLAAISAAGTADPLMGIGVAAAKFAEVSLETISMETATGAAGRVFDEVQAAGLNPETIASVATDAATWASLASSGAYATTPMTSDGRTATAATVDWISAMAGGQSNPQITGAKSTSFDATGVQDFLAGFSGVTKAV